MPEYTHKGETKGILLIFIINDNWETSIFIMAQ